MSKRAAPYYRNYYARTIERRRRLARERKVRRYWAHRLLTQLEESWSLPPGSLTLYLETRLLAEGRVSR